MYGQIARHGIEQALFMLLGIVVSGVLATSHGIPDRWRWPLFAGLSGLFVIVFLAAFILEVRHILWSRKIAERDESLKRGDPS